MRTFTFVGWSHYESKVFCELYNLFTDLILSQMWALAQVLADLI